MDTKQTDKIAAFDTLYTNNHIQMLKILLPVISKKQRHKLAVYIKYLELQYAMSLADSPSLAFNICAESENTSVSFHELLDELFPFCNEKEQQMLCRLKNVLDTVKQYKEIESTMSMMKDFFPEGSMDMDFFSMFQTMKEDH